MPPAAAALARRTTPGPKSTRYAVSFTTIAVAGPDRSGVGAGVPVPRRTIFDPAVAGRAGCCCAAMTAAQATRVRQPVVRIFTPALPNEGVDRIDHQHGPNGELEEIAVEDPVSITAGSRSYPYRKLLGQIRNNDPTRQRLTDDVALLRLSRRQAAVVFLGQA